MRGLLGTRYVGQTPSSAQRSEASQISENLKPQSTPRNTAEGAESAPYISPKFPSEILGLANS